MPRDGGPASADSLLFGPRPLPPSNVQAEQALLGAILANNKAFHSVVSFLRPEHFAYPIHARIYREAARLILRGRMVDAVTLRSVFEQSGIFEEVGGSGYLAELLSAMVGILNAGDYGRAIHDAWLRRQLIEIAETTAALAYGGNPELDGEAQLAQATEALMDLSSGATAEAPDVSVGDAARLAIQRAEAMARGDGGQALRTGLTTLDSAIGRLMPGWFYVLGGRPGMGKTSLACQLVVSVAQQLVREAIDAPPFSGAGGDVVYFSLEMPAEQTAGWMACQIAGVENDVLVDRAMTSAEAERMLRAHTELDQLPIRIIDAVGLSGAALALRVRAMHARRRVRLVVVDHLQKLVSSSADKNGDTSATAKASSALKDLARQVGCPVLVLAQLKRDVDQRDDPRPRLSDLLYAGEQDADVAFFLFRAERYLKKRPPEKMAKETDESHAKRVDAWHKSWDAARGRAELIVAKRRAGPEGTSTLRFDGPTTSFSDIGAVGAGDGPEQGRWWGDDE